MANSEFKPREFGVTLTNKLYRLNRLLTLSRGSYTTLTNGVPCTPPLNSFTDTTATNSTAFYWLEIL